MEWDPQSRSPGSNYHFLVSSVMPRPVAWVTTQDAEGTVNAAPFSWFQAVCADPPTLMLALSHRPDGSLKDTARNILGTGEFVVNVAPVGAAQQVVDSSLPFAPGRSEVDALGLATSPSLVVRPPRLAASPVHFECRRSGVLEVGRKERVHVLFGEVVHIGADDDVLDARGNVDPARVALLARMGGREYTDTSQRFGMRATEGLL